MSPPASLDSCNGQFHSIKSSSGFCYFHNNMNSSSSNSNNPLHNLNETNTILGFNSPPLAVSRNPGVNAAAGSGSNFSRPRLMKMRRQTSHNPRNTTASGIRRGEDADAGLGFNPFRPSSESIFGNSNSENVPKRAFSFGAGSSKNPSVLLDDLMKLNIDGNKNYANDIGGNSAFNFEALESENKKSFDESLVGQLPKDINKLNIGSSGNPASMKNFQEVNPMKSGFTFRSNLETELHEMHKMNLGKPGNVGWASDNLKSFVFGKNIKSSESFLSGRSEPVIIGEQHDDENLKVSGAGDDNLKTFVFGTNSGTDPVNRCKQHDEEEVKADLISDKMQSGTFLGNNLSFDHRKIEPKVYENRNAEFTFTSKLNNSGAPNVELKTPESKKESFKETKLKKTKGKGRKPVVGQLQPKQGFVFGQTSFEIPDSFEAYSPVEVSQETSVTSDDNDGDVKCTLATESFRTATENREAFVSEFSSAATSGIQEKRGTQKLNFGSKLENISKDNFTFSASSSNQSQLSPDTRQHKKKHRIKTRSDAKNAYASSSSAENFPISGNSSLLSTEKTKKVDKFNPKNEQDSKHETFSTVEACEKWRLRGNQAYGNGDVAKAEDYYTQGLNSISQTEKSRDCLRALMLCYSNRAATRISLGKMREALKDCLMAAAIDPNFLKVQVRAAHCYLAIGEIENATLQYMKCLQTGSDISVDRKLLVEASEGLEKAQKVTECIKQYIELPRRTCDELECGLRVIDEALKISCYSEQLLQMKADTLLMLRRYEQVIQTCEQTLTSAEVDMPTKSSSWRSNLIAKSYFNLGRLEEALEFIEKQESSGHITEGLESMTLDSVIPLADTIHELLSRKAAGNEAYKSGKYAEAVEHYTATLSCSVESRPFAAICFCNRAAAYRALGQIPDAIADCSLAIALDPNYLKAISRRGSLYEMIRDYGQAAIDLRRLVSLLTSQIEENGILSGVSDKSSGMNELRQTQLRLYNIEEESRKEIPLNVYLILGVESTASASEVKKAYRKAALKHHPDKAALSLSRSDNGDDGIWKEIAENVHKDADRLFKMIGEAYAVLSDPSKKSRYDLDEEMRNEVKKYTRSGSGRMAADVQSPVFERSGSRRFQDSWRPYVHTQTKDEEKTGSSYRYSRHS